MSNPIFISRLEELSRPGGLVMNIHDGHTGFEAQGPQEVDHRMGA